MSDSDNVLEPAECFSLVEHLQEELQARGWTWEDLSQRCTLTDHEVWLLFCHLPVTRPVVDKLALTLGVSPELLVNLDQAYQRWLVRQSYPWLEPQLSACAPLCP